MLQAEDVPEELTFSNAPPSCLCTRGGRFPNAPHASETMANRVPLLKLNHSVGGQRNSSPFASRIDLSPVLLTQPGVEDRSVFGFNFAKRNPHSLGG